MASQLQTATISDVAMHELIHHVHYLGLSDGDPNKMRNNIKQKTGRPHGGGSRQNRTLIAEKARLEQLRSQTGG